MSSLLFWQCADSFLGKKALSQYLSRDTLISLLWSVLVICLLSNLTRIDSIVHVLMFFGVELQDVNRTGHSAKIWNCFRIKRS